MREPIRTPEDLRQRCFVDSDTGCWHWRGATTSEGRASIWIPEIKKVGSIGTRLSMWAHGMRPPRGTCWRMTCPSQDCVNPGHRVFGPIGDLQRGKPKSPLHKARLTAAVRKRSKVKTMEVADSIRSSNELGIDLAERLNISPSLVSTIRVGKSWRPLVWGGL